MCMTKSILQILFLVIFLSIGINHYALAAGKGSGLIAPGAAIKLVQSGFQGAEGPAADAVGNVYTLDMALRGAPTALDHARENK